MSVSVCPPFLAIDQYDLSQGHCLAFWLGFRNNIINGKKFPSVVGNIQTAVSVDIHCLWTADVTLLATGFAIDVTTFTNDRQAVVDTVGDVHTILAAKT